MTLLTVNYKLRVYLFKLLIEFLVLNKNHTLFPNKMKVQIIRKISTSIKKPAIMMLNCSVKAKIEIAMLEKHIL